MPPCSRLWMSCDSFCGVEYTPQLAGVPQCGPDVAGTLLYGLALTSHEAGAVRHEVPSDVWLVPSSGNWVPELGLGPEPNRMTSARIRTPTTTTPPMSRRRQSGRLEPALGASNRRPSASALARSRRWIPEVRRFAIGREDTGGTDFARWHSHCSLLECPAAPPVRVPFGPGGAMTT